MILVWKGYGLFVFIIGVFWLVIFAAAVSIIYGAHQIKDHGDSILFTTSFFAAATTWLIGRTLNHSVATITKHNVIRTERLYEVNHSLYGIPFEFWAIFWILLLLWKAYNVYGNTVV